MSEDPRVEATSKAICQSGKFECGQGCCAPICMENLGVAREKCRRVVSVHGDLARAILAAADAASWRPISEAPRDGTQILAFMPTYYVGAGGYAVCVWMDFSDAPGWYSGVSSRHEPTLFRYITPTQEQE